MRVFSALTSRPLRQVAYQFVRGVRMLGGPWIVAEVVESAGIFYIFFYIF